MLVTIAGISIALFLPTFAQVMAVSKPLLIPWLREQIDSGCYPGVNWTNEEQTEFCIPWKHALRQDSNSEDVLIFKVNLASVQLFVISKNEIKYIYFCVNRLTSLTFV